MGCMDWDGEAGVLYVHTGAKAGLGRRTASPNMGSFACLLIGIVTIFPSLAGS